MPNSIKSFADVREDNIDLFANIESLIESIVKICKLIDSRVSWYETYCKEDSKLFRCK